MSDGVEVGVTLTIDTLADFLHEIRSGDVALGLDDRLQDDLGLDSFELLEVVGMAERHLGRPVDTDSFVELTTVRDLLRALTAG